MAGSSSQGHALYHDPRLLQNLIKAEKSARDAFVGWTTHANAAAQALGTFALTCGPVEEDSVSDIIQRVSSLLAECAEAQRTYADSLTHYRSSLKELVSRENDVRTILRDRNILVNRVAKLSLKRPTSEGARLSHQRKLDHARAELAACEDTLKRDEGSLTSLKEAVLKEAFIERFRALESLAGVWSKSAHAAQTALSGLSGSYLLPNGQLLPPKSGPPVSSVSSISSEGIPNTSNTPDPQSSLPPPHAWNQHLVDAPIIPNAGHFRSSVSDNTEDPARSGSPSLPHPISFPQTHHTVTHVRPVPSNNVQNDNDDSSDEHTPNPVIHEGGGAKMLQKEKELPPLNVNDSTRNSTHVVKKGSTHHKRDPSNPHTVRNRTHSLTGPAPQTIAPAIRTSSSSHAKRDSNVLTRRHRSASDPPMEPMNNFAEDPSAHTEHTGFFTSLFKRKEDDQRRISLPDKTMTGVFAGHVRSRDDDSTGEEGGMRHHRQTIFGLPSTEKASGKQDWSTRTQLNLPRARRDSDEEDDSSSEEDTSNLVAHVNDFSNSPTLAGLAKRNQPVEPQSPKRGRSIRSGTFSRRKSVIKKGENVPEGRPHERNASMSRSQSYEKQQGKLRPNPPAPVPVPAPTHSPSDQSVQRKSHVATLNQPAKVVPNDMKTDTVAPSQTPSPSKSEPAKNESVKKSGGLFRFSMSLRKPKSNRAVQETSSLHSHHSESTPPVPRLVENDKPQDARQPKKFTEFPRKSESLQDDPGTTSSKTAAGKLKKKGRQSALPGASDTPSVAPSSASKDGEHAETIKTGDAQRPPPEEQQEDKESDHGEEKRVRRRSFWGTRSSRHGKNNSHDSSKNGSNNSTNTKTLRKPSSLLELIQRPSKNKAMSPNGKQNDDGPASMNVASEGSTVLEGDADEQNAKGVPSVSRSYVVDKSSNVAATAGMLSNSDETEDGEDNNRPALPDDSSDSGGDTTFEDADGYQSSIRAPSENWQDAHDNGIISYSEEVWTDSSSDGEDEDKNEIEIEGKALNEGVKADTDADADENPDEGDTITINGNENIPDGQKSLANGPESLMEESVSKVEHGPKIKVVEAPVEPAINSAVSNVRDGKAGVAEIDATPKRPDVNEQIPPAKEIVQSPTIHALIDDNLAKVPFRGSDETVVLGHGNSKYPQVVVPRSALSRQGSRSPASSTTAKAKTVRMALDSKKEDAKYPSHGIMITNGQQHFHNHPQHVTMATALKNSSDETVASSTSSWTVRPNQGATSTVAYEDSSDEDEGGDGADGDAYSRARKAMGRSDAKLKAELAPKPPSKKGEKQKQKQPQPVGTSRRPNSKKKTSANSSGMKKVGGSANDVKMKPSSSSKASKVPSSTVKDKGKGRAMNDTNANLDPAATLSSVPSARNISSTSGSIANASVGGATVGSSVKRTNTTGSRTKMVKKDSSKFK